MPTKNLFVFDPSVSDYQTLLTDLPADSDWVVLDPNRDGVIQVRDILANYTDLDSLQIISHGSTGAIYLGNSVLNSANIQSYTAALADIGASFTTDGDILIYGCDVAKGEAGQQFINSLAQLTGADVAASDNATGATALSGDWVLETKNGNIGNNLLSGSELLFLLGANTAPSFVASDGKVTTHFSSNSSDFGESVAVQIDGKILVGGYSADVHGRFSFALARYNPDGNLDNSFDGDGLQTTVIGLSSRGKSITLQADNKILVAGYSASTDTNNVFALARYNADGSLDTTFSDDGVITTELTIDGMGDFGSKVILQPDGKILLAGTAGQNFALVRYNFDGSLDTSFAVNGILISDVASSNDFAPNVATQSDGKILVATAGSLLRYGLSGDVDTSFSSDGKVATKIDSGNIMAIQSDGKILIAGSGNYPSDFLLTRYNLDGILDDSFAVNGIVATDFGRNPDYSNNYVATDIARSISIQNDGKIIVAGSSQRNSGVDFAMARYTERGILDLTFGNDGKVVTDFNSVWEVGACVFIQTDGNILISGGIINDGFALARYNTDGGLDGNFSSPENTLINSPNYYEQSPFNYAVILDGNVQILDAELAAAGNYSGATLTLSRHSAPSSQDIFSAQSGGTLTTLTANSYFGVDRTTIGRVTTNSAGTLTLTFNANATQSLVNHAMQQIAYANSSDAPPSTAQIDWTFNDGNAGAQGSGGAMSVTGSTTVQITAVNDSPYLAAALPDQTLAAKVLFSYTVPAGTFIDPDIEVLTYSVKMADGTATPPWLTFNASTRTFSGTPAVEDSGSFDIQITVKDAAGATASDTCYAPRQSA